MLQAREDVERIIKKYEPQQQQQQQQQGRQQHQQGRQQQQQQQQGQQQQHGEQPQPGGQRQQQQHQQQQGSLPDSLFDLPPPPQQGRQPLPQQRPASQLQGEVEDDDTDMPDVSAGVADARHPAGGRDSVQQQGSQQLAMELLGPTGTEDVAMLDADAEHSSSDRWVREQLEIMLAEAVRLADDEADHPAARTISRADRQRLQQRFQQQFARVLRQRDAPPMPQLRTWIRQQLGIKELSYDDTCDSDRDVEVPHARAGHAQQGQKGQQQQQGQEQGVQQQQQQQLQPLRRSSRRNLGQLSSTYDAQFGPTMGNSAGAKKQSGGAGGQGDSAQLGMPLTPATAQPKPRGPRQGRQR
jgi:hypothetical protein